MGTGVAPDPGGLPHRTGSGEAGGPALSCQRRAGPGYGERRAPAVSPSGPALPETPSHPGDVTRVAPPPPPARSPAAWRATAAGPHSPVPAGGSHQAHPWGVCPSPALNRVLASKLWKTLKPLGGGGGGRLTVCEQGEHGWEAGRRSRGLGARRSHPPRPGRAEDGHRRT